MALVQSGNGATYANSIEFIFNIVRFAVDTLGYTMLGSSDGTTWANTGQTAGPYDHWPNYSALAAGSWARIGYNGLEVVFNRQDSAASSLRIYVAPRGNSFDSGAAATTSPTATGVYTLMQGSGLWGTTSNCRGQIVGEDADVIVNGIAMRPFYATHWVSATQSGFFRLDALLQANASDLHPYILQANNGCTKTHVISDSDAVSIPINAPMSFENDGLPYNMSGLQYQSQSYSRFPEGASPTPAGEWPTLPIVHCRRGAGKQGVSHLMRWNGVAAQDYPSAPGGNPQYVALVDGILMVYPTGVTPV